MNAIAETPGLGHNQPPATLTFPTPFIPEDLREKSNDFIEVSGLWLDAKKIESKEHAERANDYITGSDSLLGQLDDARKAQKKPYDDAGKAVQSEFKPIMDKIEAGKIRVKSILAQWVREEAAREKARQAEEQRKAAEDAREAERRKALAEANNDVSGLIDAEAALKDAAKAEKAAAKPVKTQVASATGGGRTFSLRKYYSCKIAARGPALSRYREHPEVLALIERLATEEVRSQKGEKVAPNGFNLIVEER